MTPDSTAVPNIPYSPPDVLEGLERQLDAYDKQRERIAKMIQDLENDMPAYEFLNKYQIYP